MTQASKPTAAQVKRQFDEALSPNFGERRVFRALVGEESVAVVECYDTETLRSALERRGKKERTGDVPRYSSHVAARVAPIDADLTDHRNWSSIGDPRHFDDTDEAHEFARSIDEAAHIGDHFPEEGGSDE